MIFGINTTRGISKLSQISLETFSKFLAVLGLSKILAILEGSEQIFPRKRSLGAPVSLA